MERTLSGKLVPRKRKLYQLDHGTVHKSYKTYYSIADKMMRFPAHHPKRGRYVNTTSTQCQGCYTYSSGSIGELYIEYCPCAGLIDYHSYRDWGTKPGSKALMRCQGGGGDAKTVPATTVQSISPSTSIFTGNTIVESSGGVAEGRGLQKQQCCGNVCGSLPPTTAQERVKSDAAVQCES